MRKSHEELFFTRDWRDKFLDERARKELRFAEIYSREFGHGTDGHHRLLLIATLSKLIDECICDD